MQSLHHGPRARSRKLHQAAGQGARDPKGAGHSHRIKLQQPTASHGCAKWTGGARSVEAVALVAMLCRAPAAIHNFKSSSDGRKQLTATASLFLRYRER